MPCTPDFSSISAIVEAMRRKQGEQHANAKHRPEANPPRPARRLAAYEAAQVAAEAGGWEFGLSMAAANAYAAYDKLNRRIAQKGVKP